MTEEISPYKDIASAPKDGSYIDLIVRGRRITDCYWYAPQNTLKGAGWLTSNDTWLTTLFGPAKPTHWAYAPPLPK